MIPASRVSFSSKKDAFEFVHWDFAIEHILAKTDFAKIDPIFVCAQPSLLSQATKEHPFLIIGSHPDELSQFFETHSSQILSSPNSTHFHLIDVPGRTCANLWQRLSFLKRNMKQADTLRTLDVFVYLAQTDWLHKHPIEQIHHVQKSIPVNLIPRIKDVLAWNADQPTEQQACLNMIMPYTGHDMIIIDPGYA